MSHKKGSCKAFLLGSFLGGVIGSISALLFAPKEGKKLRKDIVDKYNDLTEKTHDLYSGACSKYNHLFSKVADLANCAKRMILQDKE
jgi:gas vesicle protein